MQRCAYCVVNSAVSSSGAYGSERVREATPGPKARDVVASKSLMMRSECVGKPVRIAATSTSLQRSSPSRICSTHASWLFSSAPKYASYPASCARVATSFSGVPGRFATRRFCSSFFTLRIATCAVLSR